LLNTSSDRRCNACGPATCRGKFIVAFVDSTSSSRLDWLHQRQRGAYYNRQDKPARALFTVSPARRLRELFDQLHDLTDPAEVVRRSKVCEVDFLPPGSVPGA
jgi:hypothetical protein